MRTSVVVVVVVDVLGELGGVGALHAIAIELMRGVVFLRDLKLSLFLIVTVHLLRCIRYTTSTSTTTNIVVNNNTAISPHSLST